MPWRGGLVQRLRRNLRRAPITMVATSVVGAAKQYASNDQRSCNNDGGVQHPSPDIRGSAKIHGVLAENDGRSDIGNRSKLHDC